MAFTNDQYNTLVEAIAQGALTVKYADKEVTYRSLEDMIRIKNLMEADLGMSSGGIKTTYASFSKGLNSKC
ncbi:phage head-tail joining protein [Pinibacter soli]|uniref:Uncharacterized protein n=1 Tax=Pinibacter soli TaxID=3044211 RepID=A0ABT6RDR5_9BACT|nr:hypothetical protein [Pinibacter soli]MDI3319982.1 hypothetical protein [Pinibacter soli]